MLFTKMAKVIGQLNPRQCPAPGGPPGTLPVSTSSSLGLTPDEAAELNNRRNCSLEVHRATLTHTVYTANIHGRFLGSSLIPSLLSESQLLGMRSTNQTPASPVTPEPGSRADPCASTVFSSRSAPTCRSRLLPARPPGPASPPSLEMGAGHQRRLGPAASLLRPQTHGVDLAVDTPRQKRTRGPDSQPLTGLILSGFQLTQPPVLTEVQ